MRYSELRLKGNGQHLECLLFVLRYVQIRGRQYYNLCNPYRLRQDECEDKTAFLSYRRPMRGLRRVMPALQFLN